MKIEYIPDKGFRLNSNIFNWEDNRASVRQKLNNQHKEDDRIIEMAQFFGGDKSNDIEQRRDIYQNINNTKNYFFLSYDKEDRLNELEIHLGINVQINNVEMEFEKDIQIYIEKLQHIGYEWIELEKGNYLFEKLKMTIADSESIGGDGNGLSYFYSGFRTKY